MSHHTVEIIGFEFKPKVVVIQPGDRVSWINRDGIGHSAKSSSPPEFDTGILNLNEESESEVFNEPPGSRIAYICEPHPNMKGEIEIL